MLYTGMDTDLGYEREYLDKYDFLRSSDLATLKRFGNLLVSFDRFIRVFQRIAKEKFDDCFKAPFNFDENTSKLYNDCLRELILELTNLTGFESFTFRVSEAKNVEEKVCFIIERSSIQQPLLISDWEELSKLPPSKTHKLEIDINLCYGWIISLEDKKSYGNNHYLSTHTFYSKNHEESTNILRSCGFNVTLDNWG